jgi:hypothetical protein
MTDFLLGSSPLALIIPIKIGVHPKGEIQVGLRKVKNLLKLQFYMFFDSPLGFIGLDTFYSKSDKGNKFHLLN